MQDNTSSFALLFGGRSGHKQFWQQRQEQEASDEADQAKHKAHDEATKVTGQPPAEASAANNVEIDRMQEPQEASAKEPETDKLLEQAFEEQEQAEQKQRQEGALAKEALQQTCESSGHDADKANAQTGKTKAADTEACRAIVPWLPPNDPRRVSCAHPGVVRMGLDLLPKTICMRCQREVNPLRAQQKSAQTRMCPQCNYKGVKLTRIFGHWPPREWKDIEKETQKPRSGVPRNGQSNSDIASPGRFVQAASRQREQHAMWRIPAAILLGTTWV